MLRPRKLLLGAAALLMPLTTVTLVLAVTGGTANAGIPSSAPAISCTVSGDVAFDPDTGSNASIPGFVAGLSQDGGTENVAAHTIEASVTTSVTSESIGTAGACAGSTIESGLPSFSAAVTKCSALNTPYPGCPSVVRPPVWSYGTWDAFTSSASTKAIHAYFATNPMEVTLGNLSDLSVDVHKVFSIIQGSAGSTCVSPDLGFQLQGVATNDGNALVVLNACLGADTNNGNVACTGEFGSDLLSACTVYTAAINPSDSRIELWGNGRVSCTSMTGPVGSIDVSGCTGTGSAVNAGGGGVSGLDGTLLATGGPITWSNGDQTTIAAPAIGVKNKPAFLATNCPNSVYGAYSGAAGSTLELEEVQGAVTADSLGIKLAGGKFGAWVCLSANGYVGLASGRDLGVS